MVRELYFEDVSEGYEIPPLVRDITRSRILKYADAGGDYNPIHVNEEFAKKVGLGGIIAHGMLSYAFLVQMMTNWLPKPTYLKRLGVEFRAMVFPGDVVTCKGKVVRKYVKDGENYIECEIWCENQKGEKTTIGMAVATLPSREQR
ncbi:MaoC family dehydratase [Candidatus Alkanophaga liquidiphilum]